MPNRDAKKEIKRVCVDCGSSETRMHPGNKRISDGTIGDPYPLWHKHKDKNGYYTGEWQCDPCYKRLVTNPRWNPISREIHNPRRLVFLGKVILLDWYPRTGKCSRCNAVVGTDCKKTDMHHYFYVPCMPWACTEEICPRCHKPTKKDFRRKKLDMTNRKCINCGCVGNDENRLWYYKGLPEGQARCGNCYWKLRFKRKQEEKKKKKMEQNTLLDFST